MSLNIQSLPAKFNEFSELMTEFPSFESCPEIICLQETWNVVDNSMFPLANYHPLITNLRRSARGGGVGMYIKENLSFKILSKFSIFVERIFESVFIEVSLTNGKKIIIGSIYRPGTKSPGVTFTEQYAQFSELLNNLLAELRAWSMYSYTVTLILIFSMYPVTNLSRTMLITYFHTGFFN